MENEDQHDAYFQGCWENTVVEPLVHYMAQQIVPVVRNTAPSFFAQA